MITKKELELKVNSAEYILRKIEIVDRTIDTFLNKGFTDKEGLIYIVADDLASEYSYENGENGEIFEIYDFFYDYFAQIATKNLEENTKMIEITKKELELKENSKKELEDKVNEKEFLSRQTEKVNDYIELYREEGITDKDDLIDIIADELADDFSYDNDWDRYSDTDRNDVIHYFFVEYFSGIATKILKGDKNEQL